MNGPGEYLPDSTERIARPSQLPQPIVQRRSRNYKTRRCPSCGLSAARYATASRTLHDLGESRSQRPVDIVVTFSRHRCRRCRFFFPTDLSDLARPKCHYTGRVQDVAVRLVAEDGLPYSQAEWVLWRDHRVFVPWTTIQNWVEQAGEKKIQTVPTTYLDDALVGFSGYLAIDELYEDPCCVLSVVDNRRYNRLAYRVLDHNPSHDDVREFLLGLQEQLQRRQLKVRGITTDGSPLYPKVLQELWPNATHQLCVFHVLKDITRSLLHALAGLRQQVREKLPKGKRGRPRKEDKKQQRQLARRKQKLADLFTHRHLFVKRHLTAKERVILKRLQRGQEQLVVLRSIMDEVYRLFDRRCRMATALQRLTRLRQRVRRYKRLHGALQVLENENLGKALEYLDDRLLGSTSNAVERGNRRYRKLQKGIYRVRTCRHREQRIALDLYRELHAAARNRTRKALRIAREDTISGTVDA